MAKLTVNPWFSIWVKPRETVRQIVEYNPKHRFFFLSAIYGFLFLMQSAQKYHLGMGMPFPLIILLALVIAPFIGMLLFSIFSGLLLWTGKWIGGQANFHQIRAAVSWSVVPNVVDIGVWVIILAIFGGAPFMPGFPPVEVMGTGLSGLLIFLFFVQLGVGIWSLVILFKGLGEVQGFSAWKAVLNVVIPFILIFGALMLLGWLLSFTGNNMS